MVDRVNSPGEGYSAVEGKTSAAVGTWDDWGFAKVPLVFALVTRREWKPALEERA